MPSSPPSGEPSAALRGALELSLEALERGDVDPLAEPDPNSLALLWTRMNDKLAGGLPREITDQELWAATVRYRAERLRWEQELEARPPRKRRDPSATTSRTPATPSEW